MFAVVRVLMPFETHYIIFRCQIVCALARASGLAYCATVLRIVDLSVHHGFAGGDAVVDEALRI